MIPDSTPYDMKAEAEVQDKAASIAGDSFDAKEETDELDPVALNKAFKFATWCSVGLVYIYLLSGDSGFLIMFWFSSSSLFCLYRSRSSSLNMCIPLEDLLRGFRSALCGRSCRHLRWFCSLFMRVGRLFI